MRIPFVKAHGARNDFLLTWANAAPAALERAAAAICDRNAGVGADGWLLVTPPAAGAAAIRLFNPDGGEVELSGNGTRCAAAFLADAGLVEDDIAIQTGAGLKRLKLLRRDGLRFDFEMDMGEARIEELEAADPPGACILNVGNPQCAFFVDDFDFDWKSKGAATERQPRFPRRTNVSFVKVLDRHTLDVRFWERGAGFTLSSGTGSTGAVAAALARGRVESPVVVRTLAGPLDVRALGSNLYLQGPAEIIAAGEFYLEP